MMRTWNGYKGLLIMGAFVAAMLGLPVKAHATLVLYLEDGDGNAVLCVDNDLSCDDSNIVGQIDYDEPIGVWIVDVQAAFSNAPGGSVADLHLTSSLQANDAGELTMVIYDTFTAPAGPGTLTYFSDGSGSVVNGGTLTGYGAKSNSELEFLLQTDPCSYDLETGPFEGCETSVDHGTIVSPYTMFLHQTVTVDGPTGVGDNSVFSIDSHATNTSTETPEPASLTLLGLGLAGVGAVARRRRNKQADVKL